jgi:hypothetical protein
MQRRCRGSLLDESVRDVHERSQPDRGLTVTVAFPQRVVVPRFTG